MRVCVFDYGAGNLHSLTRALEKLGHTVRLETDAGKLAQDDLLVLPGVGNFGQAAKQLEEGREEVKALLEAGLPCVGICLGMQLLFEDSEEDGRRSKGLGFLKGHVKRLSSKRVPHIGWEKWVLPAENQRVHPEPVEGREGQVPLPQSVYMYFAHSYVCAPSDASVVALSAFSEDVLFPAVVRKGRVVGVQCHPEKSSTAGVLWLGELLKEVTR